MTGGMVQVVKCSGLSSNSSTEGVEGEKREREREREREEEEKGEREGRKEELFVLRSIL
jgi:hypothetical protein